MTLRHRQIVVRQLRKQKTTKLVGQNTEGRRLIRHDNEEYCIDIPLVSSQCHLLEFVQIPLIQGQPLERAASSTISFAFLEASS